MSDAILLVEDEDNIALALSVLIEREGYAFSRIADGALAMDAIRKSPPALVILDVMLPNVSGYEICQQIRLDEALKDVKILMMTARGAEVERRKGLALGADAFVSKPFSMADLRLELRNLLAKGG